MSDLIEKEGGPAARRLRPITMIAGTGTCSGLRLKFLCGIAPLLLGCMPFGASAAAFPLHIEAGKRYLVDAQGAPFLLTGDTPSSIEVQLTQAQVLQYLDDRKARRFNTILFELIEHKFADNPPYNAFGEAPFAGKIADRNGSACISTATRLSTRLMAKLQGLTGETPCWDFSKPNEAYWRNVDFVIRSATDRGFLILAEPAYLGFAGQSKGWYQDMIANGPSALRAYGAFLGNRYRAYNNIIWIEGGDFVPTARGTQVVEAVANGILSVLPDSIHSAHTIVRTSALDYWAREPWLKLNLIYSDELPYAQAQAQYRASQVPFFLIEATYEGEPGTTGEIANEAQVRSEAYQAVLTGAFGQLLGQSEIWPMLPGWQTSLSSPGSQSMTHLQDLLSAQRWWLLVPDAGTLVTSGQGSAASFSPAATASDRSFALVYFATGRGSLGINLAALAGPRVNASWFDPSVGGYRPESGTPFAAAGGSRQFAPPGRNGHGLGDWVLVLRSAP